MQWQDKAVILETMPFGDKALIVSVLTREYGRHRGLFQSVRKTSLFPGAQIHAVWTSRLEDNLGVFRLDQPFGHALELLHHYGALSALRVMCMLAQALLPERVSLPLVYEGFCQTVSQLATPQGLQAYDAFEELLLCELGYQEAAENDLHALQPPGLSRYEHANSAAQSGFHNLGPQEFRAQHVPHVSARSHPILDRLKRRHPVFVRHWPMLRKLHQARWHLLDDISQAVARTLR